MFQLLSQKNRFKIDEIRFCACEIILAIEFLHDNNIFHKDLKPENVLIGTDGHLLLADFGLSEIQSLN